MPPNYSVSQFDQPVDWRIDLATGEMVTPPEYVTGLDAVVQGLVILLQMIGGELFQDTSVGLDYLQRDGFETSPFGQGGRTITHDDAILGGKFDPNRHRTDIRDMILSVPAVRRINRLSLSFDGEERALIIVFGVNTIYGDSDLITAGVPLT